MTILTQETLGLEKSVEVVYLNIVGQSCVSLHIPLTKLLENGEVG